MAQKIFKYFLIGLFVILAIVLVFKNKSEIEPVSNDVLVGDAPKGIDLCFVKYGNTNSNGFSDKFVLKMNLDGEKATGELNLIPAEKDSKVGKFEGTVGPVDPYIMGRKMDLWWDTKAEGMNVKEELSIIFGEGTASVGFGEMVDRGDGVYIYKEPQNISYSLDLNDVACGDVDEKENVEAYLKQNITSLSPIKATLGGKWYVVSTTVDVNKNEGAVVYEDGHFQEKTQFTYTVNESGEVVVQKFAGGEVSPNSLSLFSKSWEWVSTSYSNGTNITPKEAKKFFINFKNDNTFAVSTDCNDMGGSFIAKENNISFGGIYSTKKYCEGSQEVDFRTALEQAETYSFNGKNELVLNLKNKAGYVILK